MSPGLHIPKENPVKKYLPYLITAAVVLMFADKIRALPGVSKLPSF